jgi:hypothetical protein
MTSKSARAFTVVAVLVFAVVSSAYRLTGIDGRWVGTMKGPDGPGQVLLDLKTDGQKISGTARMFNFPAAPIADGTISGSDVSFAVPIMDGQFKLAFKGKLDGERLTLAVDTPMGSETVPFIRPPAPGTPK